MGAVVKVEDCKVGCQREKNAQGDWICHYCLSLWTEGEEYTDMDGKLRSYPPEWRPDECPEFKA